MAYKLPCEKKPPELRSKSKRGEPFRQIIVTRYVEATNHIVYLHPTKGFKVRRATQDFLALLGLTARI